MKVHIVVEENSINWEVLAVFLDLSEATKYAKYVESHYLAEGYTDKIITIISEVEVCQ